MQASAAKPAAARPVILTQRRCATCLIHAASCLPREGFGSDWSATGGASISGGGIIINPLRAWDANGLFASKPLPRRGHDKGSISHSNAKAPGKKAERPKLLS